MSVQLVSGNLWRAPYFALSGIIYPVLGKYEEAVKEGKKAIELDPDFAIAYNVLAPGYEELDRLGEAENTLRRASERELEIPDFMVRISSPFGKRPTPTSRSASKPRRNTPGCK